MPTLVERDFRSEICFRTRRCLHHHFLTRSHISIFSFCPKAIFIFAPYIRTVRFRPETSTSERQLVLARAASGRRVSLEQLAAWRKDGLLPPLASHGIRAAGRCYYW